MNDWILRQSGNDIGLEGADLGFTHAELARESALLASKLQDAEVANAEPIILQISNGPWDVIGFLGIWAVGAVVVPLHVGAAASTREMVVRRTGARFSVAAGSVGAIAEGAPATRPLLNDAALIVFTSGSTGVPKGVVIGHGGFIAKLEMLSKLLPLARSDVVLCPLQLTFIFGMWVTFLGLANGARVVLLPKFSMDTVGGLLRDCTTLAAVPTMLKLIVAAPRPAPSKLRRILTGGESLGLTLPSKLKKYFPEAEYFDLFGLTETGSCDFCLAPSDQSVGLGTIGRPVPGVQFKLVPTELSRSEREGELQIKTPSRMLGYLDDPTLTDTSFDNGFFKTGDLARLRDDGLVELVGRSKEIISRGGNKIAPLEIDNLFGEHPAVAAALCFSVPHANLGEALHMMVVLRSATNITDKELRAWAATKIEKFKIPDQIHIVEALPLGRTGKADRRAAASWVLSRSD
ncbi:AMP-binding protein [Bradyrhizobium sp. Ash2021]|uniref:class I adenylate-forming enzyme family protein n=1 Tax=Bradyrhizobium sp. Ash2021 TaxID=2954771 RepID=UPI002815DFDF|nr:AMP-binding protein [Bradyrhizobium sp. Ash2021]WMT76077.1 AMP-binding protein [Bradyrhizobium sp. Ash2021]